MMGVSAIYLNSTVPAMHIPISYLGEESLLERRGGPVVRASDFGPSDPSSIPRPGDYVVSLGKILYSLSASSSRTRTLEPEVPPAFNLLRYKADVKEPLRT